MNNNLTSQEWALLHRAMDQVEKQRNALPVPRAEKIRASALATYQHQGIPVSEQELDVAVEETLAQWHAAQRSAKPSVSFPSLPSHLLWRWSQAWSVVPADENLLGKRSSPVRGGAIHRWEQALLPYAEHLPQSDRALAHRLEDAARFQLDRWNTSARTGLAVGVLALTVGSGIVLLGGGFAGVAFAALNVYWTLRLMLKGVDAQAKLALIGQALEDLQAQRWESVDLKRALQGTGMLVRGSLKPLPVDSSDWATLHRKVRGLPDLEARCEVWGRSPVLRENDRLVLEQTRTLMLEHPTRELMRKVFEKVQKAVAPLLWRRR